MAIEIISWSISMEVWDQARIKLPTLNFVGPDLGTNCLQRLLADNTIRQRFKYMNKVCIRKSGARALRSLPAG